MKKQQLKDAIGRYLHFTRNERLAVISLGLAIIVLRLLPHYLPVAGGLPTAIPDSLLAKLDSETSLTTNTPTAGTQEVKLKKFNPNTASREELMALGIPPRTAGTIEKFREKGGVFRSPADLSKIYGMPPMLARQLEVYVVLPPRDSSRSAPQLVAVAHNMPVISFSRPPPKRVTVKLNASDSMDWRSLRGIGAVLSGRIIRYRNRLGGFRFIEQLKEVYGISDSLFTTLRPQLMVDSSGLEKININTASATDLAKHPYIRWPIANQIVQYRNRHGPFKNLSQLSSLHLIDSSLLVKLTPYCKIE